MISSIGHITNYINYKLLNYLQRNNICKCLLKIFKVIFIYQISRV